MDLIVILIALLVIVTVGYGVKTVHKLNTWKRAGISYVPGLPLVGNIGPYILGRIQIGQLHQQFYNMFPDAKYFGIFHCTSPVLMLRDPELVTQVTIKHFDHFTYRAELATVFDKPFGNSLFELNGDRWKPMRGLLSPVFTSSKLKYSIKTISDCAKSFTDVLINRGSKVLQMKDLIDRYANDVICRFAFGIDVNTVKYPNNEVFKTAKEIFAFNGILSLRLFTLSDFPLITKIFRFSIFPQRAQATFKNMIQTVVEEREQKNISKLDMIQLVIDEMKKCDSKLRLDLDDIIAQSFFFFLAGFETTSSYLTNVIYTLGFHQEIQDKLMKEIDEVNRRTEGNPSYEDIRDMLYLNCVVNEVGRLYAPIPFITRKCIKTFELPPTTKNHPPLVIEPGTVIFIPIYALQHDPKYFAEPEKFDPDRFLSLSGPISSKNGVYLPFGSGPRFCIGIRLALITMKMYLFHLLSKVRIKPIEGSVFPMKMASLNFNILPFDEARVVISRRV